jgi:hypothetical protein
METYGRVDVNFHILFQASGQLHVLPALHSGEKAPVFIKQDAKWAPGTI